MKDGEATQQHANAVVTHYLQSWGLREFHDETSYYEWQRRTLSPQDLNVLQSLVERRQGGEHEQADVQFYDLLATRSFLPVLYSQRFDYFRQIGLLLTPRIFSAQQVLDFGCGVGILTCFFAEQHPDVQFVGVDRSARSIEVAQDEAQKRHLSNVQFRVLQDVIVSSGEGYDCILSTQALLQAERVPGLPSQNWRTFKRIVDHGQQDELDCRVGLSMRLDALLSVLNTRGRLICFEKTWNLGRRIFFQRTLQKKGLLLLQDPQPCSYQELGEMRLDGPLYELGRVPVSGALAWNEDPYQGEGETLYRCVGSVAERMGRVLGMQQSHEIVRGHHSRLGTWMVRLGIWEHAMAWGLCETESGLKGLLLGGIADRDRIFSLLGSLGDLKGLAFEGLLQDCWGNFRDSNPDGMTPGYENHFPSAQLVYEALPHKNVQQESTFSDGDGKEMHMEIGTTKMLQYLYWANTFDQRQLLLMDEHGAEALRQYYQESLDDARDSSGHPSATSS